MLRKKESFVKCPSVGRTSLVLENVSKAAFVKQPGPCIAIASDSNYEIMFCTQ